MTKEECLTELLKSALKYLIAHQSEGWESEELETLVRNIERVVE